MMMALLEMLGTMMAVLLVQYCDDHCLQWLRVFGHLLKRELYELHLNVLWSLAMLQMMTMMMMMISPAPSWVLPSVRKCRCAKKVSGREMVIRFSHNNSLSDCTSNWSLSHCSENIVFTLPSKSRTEYQLVIVGVERSKIIFSNLFPLWECFEEGGMQLLKKVPLFVALMDMWSNIDLFLHTTSQMAVWICFK